MALVRTHQRVTEAHLKNNPSEMDRYAMQMYGMSAAKLESNLLCLVDISKGNMPSGAPLKSLYQEAKQNYGWSERQTDRMLEQILSHSSPQARIHNFMSASGRTVSSEQFHHVVEFVKTAANAEIEVALADRLNSSNGSNAARREFEGMPVHKHVADSSKDRAEIRDLVTLQMGKGLTRAKTLQDKQADVWRARYEIADRIENVEAKKAAGYTPSLRDEISMTYDMAAVNEASKDVGLGAPIEAGREDFQQTHGHLDDNYDPTEQLNDVSDV